MQDQSDLLKSLIGTDLAPGLAHRLAPGFSEVVFTVNLGKIPVPFRLIINSDDGVILRYSTLAVLNDEQKIHLGRIRLFCEGYFRQMYRDEKQRRDTE